MQPRWFELRGPAPPARLPYSGDMRKERSPTRAALSALCCAIACLAASANAADDPAAAAMIQETGWPAAWFRPPATARDLGVQSFSQSPFLDGKNLPPVEDLSLIHISEPTRPY